MLFQLATVEFLTFWPHARGEANTSKQCRRGALGKEEPDSMALQLSPTVVVSYGPLVGCHLVGTFVYQSPFLAEDF